MQHWFRFIADIAVRAFALGFIASVVFAFIAYFKTDDASLGNFFIQIAIIQLTVGIAMLTLSEMRSTTTSTTSTLETMSTRQSLKLDETIASMINVANLLKTMVDDIEERKRNKPDLFVAFDSPAGGTGVDKITVQTGNETLIKLAFGNTERISATNPIWTLYFPPEFQIIDTGGLIKGTEARNSIYPEYTSLEFSVPSLAWKRRVFDIKIKVASGSIADFTLPYTAGCANVDVHQKAGTLQITTVG